MTKKRHHFDNIKLSHDIAQYVQEEAENRNMTPEQEQDLTQRIISYLEEHPEHLMRYLLKR